MVRTAVVGLGAQGRLLLESVHRKSKAIDITCGVTVLTEEAVAARARYDIPVVDALATVLADPHIDAVILATPPSLHADQVRQAAAAGKHIFCEKPFSLDLAAAQTAVAAARAAGVVLAIGFNLRFLPAMIELNRMIAAGELGMLLHAEGNLSHNWRQHYVPTEWRMDPSESPAKARGLTGNGIHIIDALVHLCGPVESAFGIGVRRAMPAELNDVAVAALTFAAGMTGSIVSLLCTPFIFRVQVFGTRARVEVEDFRTLRVWGDDRVAHETTYPVVATEAAELEAFAATIEGRGAYPITDREVLEGIATFEAIVNSMKSGHRANATAISP